MLSSVIKHIKTMRISMNSIALLFTLSVIADHAKSWPAETNELGEEWDIGRNIPVHKRNAEGYGGSISIGGYKGSIGLGGFGVSLSNGASGELDGSIAHRSHGGLDGNLAHGASGDVGGTIAHGSTGEFDGSIAHGESGGVDGIIAHGAHEEFDGSIAHGGIAHGELDGGIAHKVSGELDGSMTHRVSGELDGSIENGGSSASDGITINGTPEFFDSITARSRVPGKFGISMVSGGSEEFGGSMAGGGSGENVRKVLFRSKIGNFGLGSAIGEGIVGLQSIARAENLGYESGSSGLGSYRSKIQNIAGGFGSNLKSAIMGGATAESGDILGSGGSGGKLREILSRSKISNLRLGNVGLKSFSEARNSAHENGILGLFGSGYRSNIRTIAEGLGNNMESTIMNGGIAKSGDILAKSGSISNGIISGRFSNGILHRMNFLGERIPQFKKDSGKLALSSANALSHQTQQSGSVLDGGMEVNAKTSSGLNSVQLQEDKVQNHKNGTNDKVLETRR